MDHSPAHSSLIGLRHLFLLEPGIAFLNHGSFGACPREVFACYQQWQLELERQPVRFFQRVGEALLGEAREALGQFLGAAAEDLVLVTNVTMGVNIVARSLPLQPTDEVLSTDLEYGAMDNTWEYVCSKRGAHYVRRAVPLPATAPEPIVEAIWSGVTPRTRVLFISHITSGTAMLLPVPELVRRAREAGIITVVDGAHAVGQMSLDLTELGADFYVGNCHKWLMAPKGAGFLYARREMQELLEPLVVSHRVRSGTGGRSRFIAEQQYQGTRDLAAFLSVPAAIRFAEKHHWDAVRRACRELLVQARGRISFWSGLPCLTPDSEAWFVQMGIAPLPPCDGAALHRDLWDRYRIEIPVTRWGDRFFVRISLQGYNAPEDVDRLVEALAALIPPAA